MSFNDQVIAEFRANNGEVARFGANLVLLHTVGARSGEPRITPVRGIADGDAWLVVASAAGSTKHPAWYFNIVAQPLITLETAAGTFEVLATEVEGAEWDAAWATFTAFSPAFAEYRTRSEGREFPILRLTRR